MVFMAIRNFVRLCLCWKTVLPNDGYRTEFSLSTFLHYLKIRDAYRVRFFCGWVSTTLVWLRCQRSQSRHCFLELLSISLNRLDGWSDKGLLIWLTRVIGFKVLGTVWEIDGALLKIKIGFSPSCKLTNTELFCVFSWTKNGLYWFFVGQPYLKFRPVSIFYAVEWRHQLSNVPYAFIVLGVVTVSRRPLVDVVYEATKISVAYRLSLPRRKSRLDGPFYPNMCRIKFVKFSLGRCLLCRNVRMPCLIQWTRQCPAMSLPSKWFVLW